MESFTLSAVIQSFLCWILSNVEMELYSGLLLEVNWSVELGLLMADLSPDKPNSAWFIHSLLRCRTATNGLEPNLLYHTQHYPVIFHMLSKALNLLYIALILEHSNHFFGEDTFRQ